MREVVTLLMLAVGVGVCLYLLLARVDPGPGTEPPDTTDHDEPGEPWRALTDVHPGPRVDLGRATSRTLGYVRDVLGVGYTGRHDQEGRL